MKKYLVFLFGMVSLASGAQNSHLVKKDGTKIIVDDNEVDVVLIDRRVSYKLPGKTWEKYVKFDDLDYLVYGQSKLKSFNLDNAKKSSVWYVLGEGEKTLLSLVYSSVTQHGNMTSSNTYYNYAIIDKNNSIIARGSFTASDRERNDEAKSLALSNIKQYFSDCPEVISRLESSKGGIEGFLADPTYTNCN